MDSKRKNIMIAGAAVTVLALSVYAYYSSKSGDKQTEEVGVEAISKLDGELIQKIKTLGAPIKDKNDKLAFKYLEKFCEIVGLHTKLAEEMAQEDMFALRLEAYKNQDDEKYEEIVMKLVTLSEDVSTNVIKLAAEQIGL